MASGNWLDRAVGLFAPQVQLKRTRARLANDLVLRQYEAASHGRRTAGWNRSSGDANAVSGPSLQRLRDAARDLVRNNPYAEAALKTIADHTVGWGILAKPLTPNVRAMGMWKAWSETTDCDADGQHDFAGLQKLVIRSVVESGEVFVRRRWRLPQDNLPIPMQLQILEADYLDTNKHNVTLPNGGRIVYGVELDPIGAVAAYWFFPDHPGNSTSLAQSSVRVPADGVTHVFEAKRPGQVRGVTWFANVLLRFKDLDDYEDATLVKQKVSACLAIVTTDADGIATPLGQADDSLSPGVDMLSPGAIINTRPGQTMEVVQPPSVREYADYMRVNLKSIASGLGICYEDMTGDYAEINFSAGRLSRLQHYDHVYDWRWRLMIPQFCVPIWDWAMQATAIMGAWDKAPISGASWTPPPIAMIEPDKEGLAIQRNIRTGIQTLSEAVRERGYDPETFFAEMAADNAKLDKLGIILDSDPRQMTQAGQLQGKAVPKPVASVAPVPSSAARAADGHRYQVQTTYGYYPDGTWGHASFSETLQDAMRSIAPHWHDCRVFDLQAGRVVWSPGQPTNINEGAAPNAKERDSDSGRDDGGRGTKKAKRRHAGRV